MARKAGKQRKVEPGTAREARPRSDVEAAVARAERTQKALRLRKAGVSYDEIGRQLGVDRTVIAADVQGAIREIYQEEGKELLALEIERLNMLMFASWGDALRGDRHAIQSVLGCIDRRVRLGGIDPSVPRPPVDEVADRPVKIEVVYSPGVGDGAGSVTVTAPSAPTAAPAPDASGAGNTKA